MSTCHITGCENDGNTKICDEHLREMRQKNREDA